MITPIFKPEWRTQSRLKRRIYTKYMTWLERGGYLAVAILVGLFVCTFIYRVDDFVTDEAVTITPAATKLAADDASLVVKVFPADFDEVKKGEPLMEVVKGDANIRQYRLWEAFEASKAAGDKSVVGLAVSRPAALTLVAPCDGTFRTEAAAGATLDKDGLLARVVDYRDLQASGSFKGDTVAGARVGQSAVITGISVDTGNDTIFRATSPIGSMISRSIAGDEVKTALQKSLQGTPIHVRDDLPLAIKDVTGVEVDAVVKGQRGGAAAVTLDPPTDLKLTGKVISGDQMAEVQIAELPAAALRAGAKALDDTLKGKTVGEPEGSALTISDVRDAKYIVKAKAVVASGRSGGGLSGSALSRSFDATIQIDSPPAFLIQKVRMAERLGKSVTAKVQIRTGSRPIAFILLRRS